MTSADEIKRLKVIKWRCENDLLFFTRFFFKELQGRKFIVNSHHHAIVDALKKVDSGEYENLVINIPPRHGKTELVVKMWLAQTFARNPKAQFVHVSYSDQLALDNSAYVKEIIECPTFQQLWPVSIKEDAAAKGLWKTTAQGDVKAGSSGGPVTGFGAGSIDYQPGDLFAGAIISDDPLKPDDAGSAALREKVNWRFSNTLKSRRNGRHTPIVLVMQRLRQDDPSGYALAGKLSLPFHHLKIKSLQDDDTALWPAMHTADELLSMKESDRYTFASQHQQEPTPADGGVFRLSQFKRYSVIQAHYDLIVQSWDTGAKAKEANDPTACTTWGVTKTGYGVLDVFVKRMEFPEIKRAIVSQALRWNPDAILIEDKSTGESLIPMLRQETRLPIQAIMPCGDKETRARAGSESIAAGLASLPEAASWHLDYEQELALFPNSSHFDQVDSTSQFLKWMRDRTQKSAPSIRQL
jgi:predicted phage terminase large subunit-like protein